MQEGGGGGSGVEGGRGEINFIPYLNDYDSVKEVGETDTKPCEVTPEIPRTISSHDSKSFPTNLFPKK